MKMKPASGRGCSYNLPLPTALLLSFAFFFAGYYVSLSHHEDSAFERELQQTQRKQLLDNGLEFPFEHGESGDGIISDIPFQVLSWKPRALLFPRFASKQQCERIISLAKTRLAPSSLALRKGETSVATKDIRTRYPSSCKALPGHAGLVVDVLQDTDLFLFCLADGSSGTFLSWNQDRTGTLKQIEEKMARATMVPRANGEAFNVLRYQLGQKYNSHYDVFNPAEYGPQKSQRIASMLLYLSDVEEGGETMFPFENYQNMNMGYDYKRCVGLKVKPRQGDALLFYSVHPNGTFDSAALHGSCPVIKGEKWVATKWIRDITF